MATVTIKNKDGTVNKEETSRLKRNASMLETMIKRDFMGKIRKKRITEIPRDAILQGARKLMSIMPGSIGEEGKRQLMLKRISKKVMKHKLNKNNSTGGKVIKKAGGGKIMQGYKKGGKV
jgi:hypothetical protein